MHASSDPGNVYGFIETMRIVEEYRGYTCEVKVNIVARYTVSKKDRDINDAPIFYFSGGAA